MNGKPTTAYDGLRTGSRQQAGNLQHTVDNIIIAEWRDQFVETDEESKNSNCNKQPCLSYNLTTGINLQYTDFIVRAHRAFFKTSIVISFIKNRTKFYIMKSSTGK